MTMAATDAGSAHGFGQELAGLASRALGLKARTAVVGMLAVSSLIAAPAVLIIGLSKAYALACTEAGMQPLHIPGSLLNAGIGWQLQMLALILSTLVLAGAITGLLQRRQLMSMSLLALLMGIAVLWTLPPTAPAFLIWPSQFERAVHAHRHALADTILTSAVVDEVTTHYMKAQLARQRHDPAGLAEHVPPVLDATDALLYGRRQPQEEARETVQFRPEVVRDLDLTLNGQATSEIALQMTSHGTEGTSAWKTWLSVAGTLALSFSLALLGWIGRRVWHGMKARLLQIEQELLRQGWLPAAARQPDVTSSGMTLDSAGSGWLRRLNRTLTSPFPSTWVKPLRMLFYGGLVVFMAFKYMGGQQTQGAMEARQEDWGSTAEKLRPCAYVGEWASTRVDAAYKVKLTGDGQFEARPLLEGSTQATYRGTWFVQHQAMTWSYERERQSETNVILSSEKTRFSLRETNGNVTTFNLVKARQHDQGCTLG